MSAPGGRRPLAAGNWKMNLNHLEAIALVQKVVFSLTDSDLSAVDVAFLPPFTACAACRRSWRGTSCPSPTAPRTSRSTTRAPTPARSAARCWRSWTAPTSSVGHSERRTYHGETDELVLAKAQAAFRHGLIPIVCIGEHEHVRVAGGTRRVLHRSVLASLGGLTKEQAKSVVVAYEPVWAIGTGRTASPADAQEMCASIRACLADHFGADIGGGVRILYGGSVTADNATAILGQTDVDGALVGGASLKADAFADIVRAAVARTKLES